MAQHLRGPLGWTSILIILCLWLPPARGNLEPVLKRCCNMGSNLGKEHNRCHNFHTPLVGIEAEHLGACLLAVDICCLRKLRERECTAGKEAAHAGQDCTVGPQPGGEFRKDCCESCKLGLMTASMAMDCNFKTFQFGSPWDASYMACCRGMAPPLPSLLPDPFSPLSRPAPTPDLRNGIKPVSEQNLCEVYPGELCTDLCIPVAGSYICGCREGFTLMSDGKTCQQERVNNRCRGKNPCAQRCLDTGLAVECSCNPGYQLAEDNRSCDDVDECALESNQCSLEGSTCQNEEGTFSCIAADGTVTRPGFTSRAGNSINSQRARNEIESRRCPIGFELNSDTKFCDDVNECLLNTDNCPVQASCENTVGSFNCIEDTIVHTQECSPGLEYNNLSRTCDDINECSLNIDNCRKRSQVCVNTVGSFYCMQSSPQQQVSPQPQLQPVVVTHQCPAGYKYNATLKQCEDVDECGESLHSCHVETEICRNTVGAYDCDLYCVQGFQYKPTDGLCEDVNECDEGSHTCQDDETCLNTLGSYECQHSVQSTTPPTSHRTLPPHRPTQRDPLPTPLPAPPPPPLPEVPSEILPCPAGYKLNSPGSKLCVDNDECTEGTHVCNEERELCINLPGGYRCTPRAPVTIAPPPVTPSNPKCPTGFTYDRRLQRCVDIDECIETPESSCDSYQDCVNTHGSFTCVCKYGYQLDVSTQACVDINECQANQHDCLPSQRCDNTIGSYHCSRFTSCGTGYTLNAQTSMCEDDDECILKTDSCRKLGPLFQCRNTLGSFRCERKRCEANKYLTKDGECKSQECPVGFELTTQGQCADINECEQSNPCPSALRCVNTVGSYKCVSHLECSRGYEANNQGSQCVDVDECARGSHQCPHTQQCVNRPGGYVCQCSPGFTLNQAKQCIDVDECIRRVCSSNSECHNTPGSYRCECKEGFKHDEQDQLLCIDVDECIETPGLCQHKCINSWGSYRCTCNSGFLLQSDNRSCKDIDECEEFKDRTLCVGICQNQPGSYSCMCPQGYKLSSDERTCMDIDECINSGDVCRRTEDICLNTRGSYFCNAIDCPPNYDRDLEHKNRCKRSEVSCRVGDTACLQMPQMLSFNYITFVSNMKIPNIGHVDLFTMRGPMWQSTSVRFKLGMVRVRSPPEVNKATIDFFRMRQAAFNQAIISLMEPIKGPQEIELELTMNMYHNGVFGATVVAKLFIIVSEYEF